ncbi:MAG TPA: FecR domain-containing protein [Polyangiaceae bacterium]|jgi:ferric-dicitrate binding protein FerR (iron transport regulator)
MTDEAAEVRRILSPLRDRPVSVDAERMAARRARVVGSLKREVRALSDERARKPRRRAGFAAVALAAAACLLVGARFVSLRGAGAGASVLTFVGSVGDTVAGVNERQLKAGERLNTDPGEIVTATQGSAELVNGVGLGLHLGAATRVSLSELVGNENKNQVELRQGSVTCTVPHLSEGQRFSVATPDARVVVHGTVFTVQVDSKQTSGKQTCVKVTDGVVIVQHGGSEIALNAGDSWGCDESASTKALDSSEASSVDPSDNGAAEGTRVPRGAARGSERGTLSDENRLFQSALAAERLEQKDKAELDLNRLLTKYPSSPLAPEARRALGRITSAGQ